MQLGDLFDRRKFINFNTLYQCREYFFDVLKQKHYKMMTLLGNHDFSGLYRESVVQSNARTRTDRHSRYQPNTTAPV
jgi:hypothetical protein